MPPDVNDVEQNVRQMLAATCPVVVVETDVAAAVVDPVEHRTDDPLCHWGAWQSNWLVCKWADGLVEAAVATGASVARSHEIVAVDVAPAWATTAATAHWNQRSRRSALSAAAAVAAAFEEWWPQFRIRRFHWLQPDADAYGVLSWPWDACDDAAAAAAATAVAVVLPAQRWPNTFAPTAWTRVPLRSGVCWDAGVA